LRNRNRVREIIEVIEANRKDIDETIADYDEL
jgi:hypothetical protein